MTGVGVVFVPGWLVLAAIVLLVLVLAWSFVIERTTAHTRRDLVNVYLHVAAIREELAGVAEDDSVITAAAKASAREVVDRLQRTGDAP